MDGDVVCKVVRDDVNPNVVGSYVVIYEASDSSNNTSTLEIYITVYNPNNDTSIYPSLDYDPSNVVIKYIDLGKYGDNDKGESTYIKIGDIDILVDAGMGYSTTMQSIYEVLDNNITGKLDYVIASHPHEDHIGGLIPVFQQYDINLLVEFSSTYTSSVVTRYLEARSSKANLNYCKISENINGSTNKNYCVSTYSLAPSISLEFIDTTYYNSSDANSSSIVFVLNIFGTRILFNGDAERSQEIVYAPKLGKVDIIKLGHHGSKHATYDELLINLDPRVAIISNGNYLGNSNGHPTPEAINRIYEYNSKIKIFATTGGECALINGQYKFDGVNRFIDRNGTITIDINKINYSINSEYYNSNMMELSSTQFWMNNPYRQYYYS